MSQSQSPLPAEQQLGEAAPSPSAFLLGDSPSPLARYASDEDRDEFGMRRVDENKYATPDPPSSSPRAAEQAAAADVPATAKASHELMDEQTEPSWSQQTQGSAHAGGAAAQNQIAAAGLHPGPAPIQLLQQPCCGCCTSSGCAMSATVRCECAAAMRACHGSCAPGSDGRCENYHEYAVGPRRSSAFSAAAAAPAAAAVACNTPPIHRTYSRRSHQALGEKGSAAGTLKFPPLTQQRLNTVAQHRLEEAARVVLSMLQEADSHLSQDAQPHAAAAAAAADPHLSGPLHGMAKEALEGVLHALTQERRAHADLLAKAGKRAAEIGKLNSRVQQLERELAEARAKLAAVPPRPAAASSAGQYIRGRGHQQLGGAAAATSAAGAQHKMSHGHLDSAESSSARAAPISRPREPVAPCARGAQAPAAGGGSSSTSFVTARALAETRRLYESVSQAQVLPEPVGLPVGPLLFPHQLSDVRESTLEQRRRAAAAAVAASAPAAGPGDSGSDSSSQRQLMAQLLQQLTMMAERDRSAARHRSREQQHPSTSPPACASQEDTTSVSRLTQAQWRLPASTAAAAASFTGPGVVAGLAARDRPTFPSGDSVASVAAGFTVHHLYHDGRAVSVQFPASMRGPGPDRARVRRPNQQRGQQQLQVPRQAAAAREDAIMISDSPVGGDMSDRSA